MTRIELLKRVKDRHDKKDRFISIAKGYDLIGKDDDLFDAILFIMALIVIIVCNNGTWLNIIISAVLSLGFTFIFKVFIDLYPQVRYFEPSYEDFLNYVEDTYPLAFDEKRISIEPNQENLNGILISIKNGDKWVYSKNQSNLSDYESINLSLLFIEKYLN